MSVRRICLYGGPGVGRSVLAAQLFVELKKRHFPIEYVEEAVKMMAWRKEKPFGLFCCGRMMHEQIHAEESVLLNDGIVISTNSPLLQWVYASLYDDPRKEDGLTTALAYEAAYPALNLLIERAVSYQPAGRYQKDVEEAQKVDAFLLDLVQGGVNTSDTFEQMANMRYTAHDFDKILEKVIRVLPPL